MNQAPVLFDAGDVEARITFLAHVVPDARDYFKRLRELGYRRKRLKEDGVLGDVERARLTWMDEEIARLTDAVERCVCDVEMIGGQIVDLEAGEVTFPTLLDGEPAYYVWCPGDMYAMWYRMATEPVGKARLLEG